MRKFWGFYDNGTYRVGCNGATIYVYDQDNRELIRFRDIKRTYIGAFQPETNIFVAKSAEGRLAFYDLDERKLLKKTEAVGSIDNDFGFAFSPDGTQLYNIDGRRIYNIDYLTTDPSEAIRTQITVYNTSDYTVSRTFFADSAQMHLLHLEFGKDTGIGYLLGYIRNKGKGIGYGFIAQLTGDTISGIKRLSEEKFDFIREHKNWEQSGYTDERLRWSGLFHYYFPAKSENLFDRMKEESKWPGLPDDFEIPHISLEQTYREL